MFLLLMFVAVHVTVGLYARSQATSISYDAARQIATSYDPAHPERSESQRLAAQNRLRKFDPDASIQFEQAPNGYVRLHVRSRAKSFLPSWLDGATNVISLDRIIQVRIELVQL